MKKLLLLLLSFLFIACSEENPPEEILEENEETNYSSELFFSEYIEGTSFNKALEIVNLTGETINLDKYSIKKQQNGNGDWMGAEELSGEIAHEEVFVIANESADIPEILEVANQLKSGAPMDFNGNDPVGLFKNEELIDVIGEIDNPEDFATDQTLRRQIEITEPSTDFNPDSWEVFETNNVEGLNTY